MGFQGKTVFITGASSGIGAALAREFASHGANLVLAARRTERLGELAQELKNVRVAIATCDVTREEDLARAVELARSQFGGLDVVVANAGFGVVGNFERLTLDDYHRQFETNIFGVMKTIKATLPELEKSRGRLAIVGSVNGYVALAGNSAYTMSKFALRALSDSLYMELRHKGIAVTYIAPGFVRTEIRQVDNRGKFHSAASDAVPDWIQVSANNASRSIVKAILRRKRESVITGHGKFIVCFNRHFPRLFSALLMRFGVRARPDVHRT